VYKPVNIERVRNALNKVDLITLRDRDSLSVLRHMGIDSPEIHVTADAAFALPPSDEEGITAARPYFCISLRNWANYPPSMEREIAVFADYIADTYGFKAVFVPMRAVEDTDISRRVIELMKSPGLMISPDIESEHTRAVVGGAEFVLGMRLHALIYALEKNVPVIGLVYSDKVRQHMEYIEQPWHMPLNDISAERLKACADEILTNKAAITQKIKTAGQMVKEKAELNAALCVRLLNSN
jgi:polysaccharide pyruvyl transferase WcaK-like protein